MPVLLVEAAKPADLSESERREFIELVRSGGEVAGKGLSQRVAQAVVVITMREANALIGAAAIKAPSDAYRRAQFIKAGVPDISADYPLELGWIVIHDQHRGKGYPRRLIEAALAAVHGRGVYATTKSDAIKHVLPDYGFTSQGAPYASELEPDARLTLFARPC